MTKREAERALALYGKALGQDDLSCRDADERKQIVVEVRRVVAARSFVSAVAVLRNADYGAPVVAARDLWRAAGRHPPRRAPCPTCHGRGTVPYKEADDPHRRGPPRGGARREVTRARRKAIVERDHARRVRVRVGWVDAGRCGTALGPDVLLDQPWTPVLWDDEEDPTFNKAAGLVDAGAAFRAVAGDAK